MATAWVILGRVLRVGPGPGDAAAEAQEQLAAAAAVGAEAQEQHAAAEEAQEQHAAAEEAQEQHAEPAAAPDFTLQVALPPRVTVLAAGRGAHPEPENPDAYPYIIAAGPLCLLAHFAASPFYGTQFGDNPHISHLVVVRDFRTAEGRTTATAEHVADRTGRVYILWNIGNVVLASNDSGDYTIAELQFNKGSDRATFIYLRSTGPDRDMWKGKHVAYPLAAADREWIPHGTAYVDGALWWFDLSWGILSYDASLTEPDLVFHELPGARGLDVAAAPPHIHAKRCVTASRNKLRYVEIITEGEAATVSMWTRRRVPGGWEWRHKYGVNFGEIWDDDSYTDTGLPRNVPTLAAVCPTNPNLVYFDLEHRLFGVNVRERRVVQNEPYELVNMPGLPPTTSSRYVLPWVLPPAVAQDHPLGALGLLLLHNRDVKPSDAVPRSSGDPRLTRGEFSIAPSLLNLKDI